MMEYNDVNRDNVFEWQFLDFPGIELKIPKEETVS
jgi:hypothetical protein